eukprot:CAMPEP_0194278742 /NCGR_PEP_ID=MMETSP0169-20130528/12008_1 /TAXON_ID=218684 /ORGANISM="Corethron pennatum, Strain L29A3" /LENGTH=215 /DNA_ID=CAMNT_0039023001 /DNA_START=73 /DNA_END=720 /DNA_ORIENTATION=-
MPLRFVPSIFLGGYFFLNSFAGAFVHLNSHSPLPRSWLKARNFGDEDGLFQKRRALLERTAMIFTLGIFSRTPDSHAAVLAVPEDLSEGNELIRELQARSAANKEKYQKEAQRADKLSTKQFKSQYDRPKFVGVRKADGTVKMVSPEELESLLGTGGVRVETGVAKKTRDGKEYMDYRIKVYVLVDGQDVSPVDQAGGAEPEGNIFSVIPGLTEL